MSPWGPIVAAFIAALVAAVGLILNKENKISEFRQQWINEFRDEVSKLISALKRHDSLLAKEESNKKIPHEEDDISESRKTESVELSKEIQLAMDEIHIQRSKLKLRLNANEKKRTDSESKLSGLLGKVVEGRENRGDVNSLSGKIYEHAGIILKDEWERVKTGEKPYNLAIKIIKTSAIAIAVICAIFLISHFDECIHWLFNIKKTDLIILFTNK